MLGACWNWGSTSTNNGLRVWGPRTWKINCKSVAVFSTTCGYVTTEWQQKINQHLMASGSVVPLPWWWFQQGRSHRSPCWASCAFCNQFWNRSFFSPGQPLATYFYTHLGLQGPQNVNDSFIMILESSHGVHSCILKARSQEAHHMTHWTVGIWGRYASVANDGSNLPYSHLLGYAPAGNAKEMVKSWASLMSVEKCGADLRRCVPGCIVCSRIG